jgi:hypothetical protein
MTVESTAAIIRYTGDAAQTVFPYTWKILDDDDIQVYLRVIATGVETLQTKDTHYTVSGVGLDAGGNITFITSPTDYTPAATEQVVLKRVPAITQTSDYEEGGELDQEALENALDRTIMVAQRLKELIDRAVLLPETSNYSGLTLPDPVDGNVLVWNAALDALVNASLTGTGTLTVTAFVETLLDDATAAAFMTTLGITAFIQTLLDDTDAQTAKTTLGLVTQNLWIPAGAFIPLDTNGAEGGSTEFTTNDIMLDHYAFDGATEEYIAFNIVMPEGYDLGTIKAKFYWAPVSSAATAGDTVEWELAAGAISDDGAIDTAVGTGQVISDTVLGGEEGDLHISGATPAITIGGTPALGDLIHCKVSRNVGGTDDMTEDALLFGVLLQFTVDQDVAAW